MTPEYTYVPFSVIAQEPQATSPSSGLDLGPTLKWIKKNGSVLNGDASRSGILRDLILNGNGPVILPPVDRQNIQLGLSEIGHIIGLFPEQSQTRSIVTRIQGNDPLWFHKDSLSGKPRPTTNPEERLSPTALIPGYTEYARDNNGKLEATIHLYTLPEETADFITARIMLAETLCHEYVHTLTTPLLYSDDVLRLPDGTLVDGLGFVMLTFGNLAEQHTPISHYSSFYRNRNNEFVKDENGNQHTAVGEEFAETVTAHILGYASGLHTDIEDPLADRAELRLLIDDFLHARVVAREGLDEMTLIDPQELAKRYAA